MIERIANIIQDIAERRLLSIPEDRTALSVNRKAGGEPVSSLDLALEDDLSTALRPHFPGARIIGEEGAGRDPDADDRRLGTGEVLLIDPLDGTANFLKGGDDYAVMLCLLWDGVPVAAWIYLPASRVMAVAERSAGAFAHGRRLILPEAPRDVRQMSGEVHSRYLPETLAVDARAAAADLPPCPPRHCAGATYVDLARGRRHFALYYRTRPWDHAAGTLICGEAGAEIARFDGRPYQVTDGRKGLLIAPDAASWRTLRDFLLPGLAG